MKNRGATPKCGAMWSHGGADLADSVPPLPTGEVIVPAISRLYSEGGAPDRRWEAATDRIFPASCPWGRQGLRD